MWWKACMLSFSWNISVPWADLLINADISHMGRVASKYLLKIISLPYSPSSRQMSQVWADKLSYVIIVCRNWWRAFLLLLPKNVHVWFLFEQAAGVLVTLVHEGFSWLLTALWGQHFYKSTRELPICASVLWHICELWIYCLSLFFSFATQTTVWKPLPTSSFKYPPNTRTKCLTFVELKLFHVSKCTEHLLCIIPTLLRHSSLQVQF